LVERGYVPDRGDVVWVNFTPQAGHEQAGRRPALTMSPGSYNERVGLALICPITSQVKGYPFEVGLPPGGLVSGVVLADQIRSVDWRAREARFDSRLAPQVVNEVLMKVQTLLA
jgi:mRNA interferase MazF